MTTQSPSRLAVPISWAEKAAIIITALPRDSATSLLQKLGPTHINAFVKATARLKTIPEEVLERVILEFMESLSHKDVVLGIEVAKDILNRIMSPDAATDIISAAMGTERDPWDRLDDCDPEDIAAFITRGHPRAASIILSRLEPDRAAEVLDKLDAETAEAVVSGLKQMAEPSEHALHMLTQSIKDDLLDLKADERAEPDSLVGAIFDNLSDLKREPLMKALEADDPDFAQAVQRKLFLFDDIPVRIAPKDVPAITRIVDAAVLKTALGSARARESETADFILSNMSKRLAEQLEEELSEMGKIKAADGADAEADVTRAVKSLIDDGTITVVQPDDEDEEEGA